MRSWRIVLSALCVLVVGRWSPGASKDGTVLAPKDAQWTIVCKTFSGPGHAQQAKQMKELLLRTTKLRDWYLVQGEQETTLYHGFYRTFMTGAEDSKDRKEAERAQEDKKAIFLWMDPEGKQVFEHCYFVELSAPGADGPPEWNLANKDAGKPDGDPTKAYFSLEVGVYMDSPNRKQAAVDAVKEARAMGVEAYYHHGPTKSSVCVGAWPRSAVKAQESDAAKGDPGAGAQQPIIVLPFPLPAGVNEVRTPDRQKAKAMVARLEVLDPMLKQTMEKFPYHAINGLTVVKKATNPKTGRVEQEPDASFLVVIPRTSNTGKSMLQQQAPMANEQPGPRPGATPSANPPPVYGGRPSTPGGKLRSIGD